MGEKGEGEGPAQITGPDPTGSTSSRAAVDATEAAKKAVADARDDVRRAGAHTSAPDPRKEE